MFKDVDDHFDNFSLKQFTPLYVPAKVNICYTCEDLNNN